MMGGLVHEPALQLCERLCKLTGLERCFLSDSGSVAVEVAMKMAVQYWKNRGEVRRDRFISFRGAYHGDTMGAMSLADPVSGMHSGFVGYMPIQYVTQIPADEYDFADFEQLLIDSRKQVAALIIEPLVQAAGGFRFHSPDSLAEIHRLCHKHGILFIADEIATGFGRTGYMFACQEAGIVPDIMCLGKALTGGNITLAATLASSEVFDAFLHDDYKYALMHGPTYTGNPLACAAANASLDLFATEPRLAQVQDIEDQLALQLEPCRNSPKVKDVRVKGAIGIIEYDPAQVDVTKLRQHFIEHEVWLRPYANCIYIMPPLVISPDDLSTITQAIISYL